MSITTVVTFFQHDYLPRYLRMLQNVMIKVLVLSGNFEDKCTHFRSTNLVFLATYWKKNHTWQTIQKGWPSFRARSWAYNDSGMDIYVYKNIQPDSGLIILHHLCNYWLKSYYRKLFDQLETPWLWLNRCRTGTDLVKRKLWYNIPPAIGMEPDQRDFNGDTNTREVHRKFGP